MKCDHCKWKYPDHFLSAMMVNGHYTKPICGICALELMNSNIGVKRDKFHGEQAESNRLAAIDWRAAHPNDKGE